MTIVQAPAEVTPQVNGGARKVAAAFLVLTPIALGVTALSSAADNAVSAAAQPDLAGWLNLAQLVAIFLTFGWATVILQTTRRFSPVAAWIAFCATIGQLVALAVVTGFQILMLTLASEGLDPAALDKASDDGLANFPVTIVVFILFIPGLVVAFVAAAIALWRSAWVPRAVPLLLLGVLVTDIALPSDPKGIHLIPFALMLAAGVILARLILRDGAPAPIAGGHTEP